MPNLDYDPQNPTDLLDRPIKEGDLVAWGTTYGRSPAVCVARIHKISFRAKDPTGRKSSIEVPQQFAEKYTLQLQPLKSTGMTSMPTKYHPRGFIDPETGELARHPNGGTKYFETLSDKPKLKTVHLVKNVVKLEALDAED